jgi:hypothetical protein
MRVMLRRTGRHARVAAIPNIGVQVYESFESLPEGLTAFFADAGERDFFRGLPWHRTLMKTAGPGTDRSRIFAAEIDGRPVAALIVREREAAGRLKTHMLLSLSNGPYASASGLVLDPEFGAAGLRAIAAAIVRASPPYHALRFDGLDRGSREFAALAAAFRGAAMLVRPFESFVNHYADVQGQEFEHVLAQRSRVMRDFVQHALRGFAESGRGRFELCTGGPGFKSALVDYALVDVQSWQNQEIYPDCILDMLNVAAEAGVLRLGLYYVDGKPAAAQIWIVSGGHATIWRARYAKKFATLGTSPALTFEMFRRAIAADHVSEIDSGPGDDKIMQMWFDQNRERAGFLMFNPRTLKGWVSVVGHLAGGRIIARALWGRDLLRRLLGRARRRLRAIVYRNASVGDAG